MVYSLTEVSGTGTSRASQAHNLKLLYMQKLDDAIASDTEIASFVAPKRGKLGGEQAVWSVNTRPPAGVGNRREFAPLPDPSASGGFKPALIARTQYGITRLTGNVKRAGAAGQAGVFAKAASDELRLLREHLTLQFAMNCLLGKTDVRARVVSSSYGTETSVVLAGPNERRGRALDYHRMGVLDPAYLAVLMQIATIPAADGVQGDPGTTSAGGTANKMRIESIDVSDPSAPVIVVSNNGAAANLTAQFAADDLVIPYYSRADVISSAHDQLFHGPNGLLDFEDDGTIITQLFGHDKSAQAFLRGRRIGPTDGSQVAFSTGRVEFALTECRKQTGKKHDCNLLGPDTMREVSAENRGNSRFAPVITDVGYGKMGVRFGDIVAPYLEDAKIPGGQIHHIAKKNHGWYEQAPLQQLDRGDSRNAFVPGYDQDEIAFVREGNNFHSDPRTAYVSDSLSFSATAPTS